MQKQMMFWLNTDNPLHGDVWELSETLKQQRKFNPSVINGLRLIADLNDGHTDVLLELYPWLTQALTPEKPNGGDSDKILQKLADLERKMVTAADLPASPNGLTMRPKDGATKSDEPAIELTKAAKSDEPNWWDGAITMAVLTGDFTKLSPAIIEYGIRVGRVPAQYGKPKPMSVAAIPSGDGNSKVMQVPQFAAPVFDDD